MAAFVLVTPPGSELAGRPGDRIGIFPGSVTPAVYPAGAPFWIGYGFAREPGDADDDVSALDDDTRFELEVDGERIVLVTDLRVESGRPVSKHSFADFPGGLAAGWHRFEGRWYDRGRLVVSGRTTVEFVEE